MASFGNFWNGAVAQFKVLFIFVLVWCCIFATFLSRETLCETVERSVSVYIYVLKNIKDVKEIKDVNSYEDALKACGITEKHIYVFRFVTIAFCFSVVFLLALLPIVLKYL